VGKAPTKTQSRKASQSIQSVFSATPLLSITALFRELKAREDLQLGKASQEEMD
jgi:hypothetical protein